MFAVVHFLLIPLAWFVWGVPFFRNRGRTPKAAVVDRRARWGIAVEGGGFALVWMNPYRQRPANPLSVAIGMAFVVVAWAFWFAAVSALGKQWRIEAGLNADHELVRSGAYRIVRHPIYLSLLCMLVGSAAIVTTPLWELAAAIVFFLIGTEIRVRVEDNLLASRFGETFRAYQASVPAYLPLVR